MLKNLYYIEPSFNSGLGISLNEGDYILTKIDLGSSNQNLETLDLEIGSRFISSSIGYREITIEGYVSPEDLSIRSMSECKNNLQKQLSLFKPAVFSFYISTGELVPIYYVNCYPTSSISWGSTQDENNKYVCKYSVTLRALDPFDHCPIIYDSDHNGTVVIPTSTEYSYQTVVEPSIDYIKFNNIGSNPKLPIKFDYTFPSTVTMKSFSVYSDTTGNPNKITYDMGNTTVDRVVFDSQSMTCYLYSGGLMIDISTTATLDSSQPYLPVGSSITQIYYVDISDNYNYFIPDITYYLDLMEA